MTARAPLTPAEKQRIFKRKLAGATLGQIAEELACSVQTVRKWWRSQRDQRPVLPRGRPKGGLLSTFAPGVRTKALSLKKDHPHWGPASVKLELRHLPEFSGVKLPSDALLARFFKQACPEAVQARQRKAVPSGGGRVHQPHQRWQVDGKEGLRVGSDTVTLLEIHDQASGLLIASQAFQTTLPKWWRKLSWQENQQALRLAFTQSGLPREIQTDNEGCYVNINDPTFPSLFTLWLVGLGVQHVTSHPGRPTDQAEIERNHRTLGDLAWKDQSFEQPSALQQTLDQTRSRYNEEYPAHAGGCEGQAPLQTYPQAASTGRPYHPALEAVLFSMQQVDAYLARREWTRPVIAQHRVNLGGQYYLLGRHLETPTVVIHFLPKTRVLRFQSPEGQVIKELPIKAIDRTDLVGDIPGEWVASETFQLSFPWVGV